MTLARWIPTSRLAVFWIALCAVVLVLASTAPARGGSVTVLTFGDTHELGSLLYGIPSADTDNLTYVNHLAGMTPSTSDSADGQAYTRSGNGFGSLPTAGLDGLTSGSGTTILIASGDQYLFAKYDGPSDGAWVWYVGDQSGFVTIPLLHGGFGLSSWSKFQAAPPQSQPDGRIRRVGGPLRGNDVYNSDGAGQDVLLKMYAGDKRVAYISIQNEGDEADTFTVAANAGSVAGFNITYYVGRTSTDVTSAVEAGTFTTPSLAVGQVYRLRVKAKVTTSTPRGSSIDRLVTITADADGSTSDTVGFTVQRK